MNGLRVAPTAGALLAGLLVAGRWSFARLANEQSSMTFEPRLWLVALLLALAFAPAVGPLRPLTLRARAAWAGWAAFYVYFTISVAWAPDLTMALDKAAEQVGLDYWMVREYVEKFRAKGFVTPLPIPSEAQTA